MYIMKLSRLFLILLLVSIFAIPQTSLGATSEEIQKEISAKLTEVEERRQQLSSLPTTATQAQRDSFQNLINSLTSEIAKLRDQQKTEEARETRDQAQRQAQDACTGVDEFDTIAKANSAECQNAQANQQIADKKLADVEPECGATKFLGNFGKCIVISIGTIFNNAVDYLFGGIILYTAGMLLDYSVYFSVVKFADIIGSSEAGAVQTSVYSIWIFIRNIFNIIIVFELLYLSLVMIWKGFDGSAFKARLIAALVFAIGINFSFYFTKVLIDFSNIATLQIYSAINPQGDIGSISSHFMAKMNTANDFNNFSQGGGASGQPIALLVEPFVKAIFLLIMTGVFASLALVFIKRGVVLIFLLILSPLMFAEFAGVGVIKAVGGWSKKWWKALTDELFMAPLTMLMIYLVLRVMSSNILGADMFGGSISAGGSPLTGVPGSGNAASSQQQGAFMGAAIIGTLVKYLVLAALAITALKIARSFSQGSSKAVQDKIDKAGGFIFGGALGAGAWALRRTAGSRAASAMDGEWADAKREKAAQGGFGGLVARTQLKAVEGLSKSSFDARNTDFVKDGAQKMGISSLLGNAKDGGFIKDIEDDEKKKKEIFANKLKYTQKDTSDIDTSTKEGKIKKLEIDAANALRANQLRAAEATTGGARYSEEQVQEARSNEEGARQKLEEAKRTRDEKVIKAAEEDLATAQKARKQVEGSILRSGMSAALNFTAPGTLSGGKSYGEIALGELNKNSARVVGNEEDGTDEKIKGSAEKTQEALEKAKKALLEKKTIEKNQKAADRVALALLANRGDWHQEIGNEDEFKKLEEDFRSSGAINDKKAAEKIVEKQVAQLKTSLTKKIPLTNPDGSQVVDDQGNIATRDKTQEEKAAVRKQIGLLNLAKKRLSEVEKKYTEVAEEKKDDKADKKDDKGGDKK
jgi:hypothetical protein